MDPIEMILRRIGVKGDGVGPTIANAPKWYAQTPDQGTLDKVESAMRPEVRNAPWLEQLYKSGIADTLYQATGGVPRHLGTSTAKNVAAFVSPLGSVHMDTNRAKYNDVIGMGKGSPENTFMHEMGHRYDAPDNLPPMKTAEPALWALDPRKGDTRYWRDGKPSPYAAALERVDPYYRKNEDEAVSQAFANAIELLRSNDTTNVRQRMGDMEAETPGMGTIARDLLGKPVFANSPFRKVIR